MNEEVKTTEQPTEVTQTPPAVPAEPKSGWMPKKTLILILLLVVATVGLLALALLPNVKPPLGTKPTVTPALTYAQTTLSLSTPVTTALNSYSTNVLISSGSNKTTAIQLEISYDPKVLTNVAIQPGTFFTTPAVLLKKIDTVSGRISYALGISPSQKPTGGNGTVATITFSTVPGTTVTQTPINFELKTAATAIGYAQSVIKGTQGVLFVLPTTAK